MSLLQLIQQQKDSIKKYDSPIFEKDYCNICGDIIVIIHDNDVIFDRFAQHLDDPHQRHVCGECVYKYFSYVIRDDDFFIELKNNSFFEITSAYRYSTNLSFVDRYVDIFSFIEDSRLKHIHTYFFIGV